MCELEQMIRSLNTKIKSGNTTTKDIEEAIMVKPNEVIILPSPAVFAKTQTCSAPAH